MVLYFVSELSEINLCMFGSSFEVTVLLLLLEASDGLVAFCFLQPAHPNHCLLQGEG